MFTVGAISVAGFSDAVVVGSRVSLPAQSMAIGIDNMLPALAVQA